MGRTERFGVDWERTKSLRIERMNEIKRLRIEQKGGG